LPGDIVNTKQCRVVKILFENNLPCTLCTIYIRVSETFTAQCIGRLQFVLRLVCDFGILRAERCFVILAFFFVILDVLEVISET